MEWRKVTGGEARQNEDFSCLGYSQIAALRSQEGSISIPPEREMTRTAAHFESLKAARQVELSLIILASKFLMKQRLVKHDGPVRGYQTAGPTLTLRAHYTGVP